MKPKNQIVVAILAAAAFLTRVLQIFWVIDFKTGFYKNKISAVGIMLTVLTLILCATAAIFSRKAFKKTEASAKSGFEAVLSGLVSCALLYELFAENLTIQGNAWQVVLMKLLGIVAAGYFAAVGLSGILSFEIPDVIHTIPAFYMIIRIICTFINISSLSLIAENIFILASYCCLLLFFVDYSAFYCLAEKNLASLNAKSVLAFTLCFSTAAANMIANIFGGGYTHIPLNSQFALLAFALFVGAFITQKPSKEIIE